MKRFSIICVLSLLLLLPAGWGVCNPKVIAIKDTVVVQKPRVYLEDIVAGSLEGIENHFITNSPRWGSDKILTLNYIKNRLRHHNISIRGANRTIVDRRLVDRSDEIRERLIRKLSRMLERNMINTEVDSFSVDLCNFPSTVKVPSGKITLECRMPNRLTGFQSISFTIVGDSDFERRFTAGCRFYLFGTFAVARSDLNRESIIEDGDVEWRSGDIASCYETPATPRTLKYGVRVSRFIKAGRPIPLSALERKPDVKRGRTVTVKITRGALCVTTEGRSLEDGWIGDRVLVRSKVNGDIEKYIVIGESEVAPY